MQDNLYRNPRSPFWWTRFRFEGTEVRRSTGVPYRRGTRDEAARVARGIRAEYESSSPPPVDPGRGPLLIDLASADQGDAKKRGVCGGRLETLEVHWRNLIGYFGDVPITEITFDRMRDYQEARRNGLVIPIQKPTEDGQPMKPRRRVGFRARGGTIREELAAVKRAWKIARRRKLVDEIPDEWPEVRSDAPHPTRRGSLVPMRLLRAILEKLPAELRDEIAFDAMTGLRRYEIARMTALWLREVDGIGFCLEIPATAAKDGEMRPIPLRGLALAVFLARAKAVEDAGAPTAELFPRRDRRKTIARACREAGAPRHITYRDVRTTFANLAKRASKGTPAARDLMGHEDERTTNIYLRSEMAELAETIDAVESALSLDRWAHYEGTPASVGKKARTDSSAGPSTSLVEDNGFEPSTPTLRTQEVRNLVCPCCIARCQDLRHTMDSSHDCPPTLGTPGWHTVQKREEAA